MHSSSIWMIIILFILLTMSAYFSATETAFSSLNKIRLKNMGKMGNKKALVALKISEDYDKMLSTILIGNNIVNIVSASLATVLFVKYYGDLGVTLSTIVMTMLVLVFAEISPKTLAKEAPESFAVFSAPVLKGFMVVLSPLNFIFRLWKNLLAKLFKIDNDTSITEEELLTIVEEVQNEGGIDKDEGELIRSAIEFNDIEVSDILTPRVEVVGIDKQTSKEEIAAIFADSGYSRLPVFDGTIDNIIGIMNQKDFHNYVLSGEKTIKDIMKEVLFITPSAKISKLLKLLQRTQSHIAVIIDEYGGTMGIVTLEDILEELVGEIWDEHDEVIKEFDKIEENKYKVYCNANINKMFELFHMHRKLDITTVSGWIIEEMGRIPKEGDSFSYENLDIDIVKTDYRKVVEIIVTINPIHTENK